MFMKTNGFLFVDNYLTIQGQAIACVCSFQKSGFPYERFDSPEKLIHPGLPDEYLVWYSRLKTDYVLTQV